jgi:lipopolysaccharide/colanic/teichoic acid biosynthesis glycosyltransferase
MEVSFNKYSDDVKDKICNSKPGMTGIGSIIFRDEESLVSAQTGDHAKYYEDHIFPYKGALEMWYQQNASIFTDFKIIFLTAWSIVFPKNNLAVKFFKDLPVRQF